MFYVSDIIKTAPKEYKTKLQEEVYTTLETLNIDYNRVDTQEAYTMEDCEEISKRLGVEVIKTLFLCNQQKTKFYLLVLPGNKKFETRKFSSELEIARVSFTNEEQMLSLLGTQFGAATVFGLLLDKEQKIQLVLDREVFNSDSYACSDGTLTTYMSIKTEDLLTRFLPHIKHKEIVIDL